MRSHSPEEIYKRNIRVFYITEIARSLLFYVPIWVAYELQYITLAQLPIIEAVMLGIQLVLELPTGAFADLLGKRWTVFLGYLFFVFGGLVYVQARSFPIFLIYAFLFGFGDSLISGAKEALLYDTVKEVGKADQYAKIHSKFSMFFQIGLAVSMLIGGFLGSFSYEVAIWATVATTGISAIASLFFYEPLIDTEKFTLKRYVLQTKEGFREVLRTPYVKRISLFYILVGGVTWVCNLIFNMTILTQQGFSAIELGIILAIIRIVNSTVLFRGLHIGTIFTKKRTFIFFPIVMALCLLPGIVFTKWMAVAAVAGILFCSSARWTILGKYTNEEFSSKNRATAISTLSMAIGIIYVIVAVVSGPLMNWWGNAGIMFTILGIFTMIFILPLGISLRKNHSNETVSP
jgi:MFS family permease